MNTKQLEELKAWINKAKLDFYDPDGYINTPTIIGMIEHFLASQREEIAKIIEGKKIEGDFEPWTDERYEQEAHNAALVLASQAVREYGN